MKLNKWLIASLGTLVLACGGGGESVLDSTDVGRGKRDTGRDTDDLDEESEEVGTASDAGRRDASTTRPRDGGPPSGADPSCESLTVDARPNAPDILIVLDRSGSMTLLGSGVDRWTPSVRAVQAITSELTETVAFGLMTFPAPGSNTCAPGVVSVPVATNSASRIATTLALSAPQLDGQTPTAATLDVAYRELNTTCVDCASARKYVLLVTDGQPTCGASGSSASEQTISATTAAIERLFGAGIHTYVVGFDTAANAATMDRFARAGGTDRHIPVENERTLVQELTRITASLVPCEFELSTPITDPSFVRVTIDGKQYNLSDGAWSIDGKKIVLEKACDVLRDAKVHDLRIVRECKPVDVI